MNKKKIPKIITGIFAFAIFFVILTVTFLPILTPTIINYLLKDPITFADYTLKIEDHKELSITLSKTKIKANKISLTSSKDTIIINNAELLIDYYSHGFNKKAFVDLKLDSISIISQLPKAPQDTTSKNDSGNKAILFPEFYLKIPFKKTSPNEAPFPVALQINHLNIKEISKNLSLQLDTLNVNLSKPKSLTFSTHHVLYDNQYPLDSLRAKFSWAGDSIYLHTSVHKTGDSIAVSSICPKSNLLHHNSMASISVKSIVPYASFIPPQIHQHVKGIHNINGDINAYNSDSSITQTRASSKIHFSLPSKYGLPPMNYSIQGKGNIKSANAVIKGRGKGYTELNATWKGTFATKEHFATLNTKNLIIQPSPILPSAIWGMDVRYDTIDVKFIRDEMEFYAERYNGSTLAGHINSFKNFSVDFFCHFRPNDPYIKKWTEDNIQYGPMSLEGSFENGIMRGVLYGSSPYIYKYGMLDTLQSEVILTKNGVYFNESYFTTRGKTFDFNGQVEWASNKKNYQFKIRQDNNIQLFGTFDGKFSINLSEVELKSLPLLYEQLPPDLQEQLQAYNPRITGTWSHDFKAQNGDVNILSQFTFNNEPFEIKASAGQNQNTFKINYLTLLQGENNLNFNGQFSLEKNKVILDEIIVSAYNFSLAKLTQSFADSALSSGDLNGSFSIFDQALENGSYTKAMDGEIIISDILPKGMDEDKFKLPYIAIKANDQSLNLQSDFSLGLYDEWKGKLNLDINHIFNDTNDITAELAMNETGKVRINGDIINKALLDLDFHIMDKWILPNNGGELVNTDIKGSFALNPQKDSTSKSPIDVDIQHASGYYTYSDSLSFIYNFKTQLTDNILTVPRFLIRNKSGQTITSNIKLDFNKKAFIEEFDISSDSFAMTINEDQQFAVQNLKGRIKQFKDSLVLNVQAPMLNIAWANKKIGSISTSFSPLNLFYIQYDEQEINSKKHPTFSGSINIDKLIYRKMDIPEISDAANISSLLSGSSPKPSHTQTFDQVKANTESTPLDLRLLVTSNESDSMFIITNYTEFPIALDLTITGDTKKMNFNGDIRATQESTVYFRDKQYVLSKANVEWNNTEPVKGNLDISVKKDFKYCQEKTSNINEQDICTIHFDLTQTINSPLYLNRTENCESSSGNFGPTQVFTTMLLDCVLDSEDGKVLDTKNAYKFAFSLVSSAAKDGFNKFFNKEIIKDFGVKYDLTDQAEVDTNSVYLDFALGKNTTFKVAYEQGVDVNHQSVNLGVSHLLPILDNSDQYKKNPNQKSRGTTSVDLSVNTILSSDQETTESGESSLGDIEPKAGIHYNFSFWKFCFGECND